jgi:hypothetical protein
VADRAVAGAEEQRAASKVAFAAELALAVKGAIFSGFRLLVAACSLGAVRKD